MFQSVQKLAERTSSIIAERPFAWGILVGLAAALVLLLVFLLLNLIFRSRKLGRIVIPSEGGDLRIDAKAVQGAVRSVAANFPAFDVRRVALYGAPDAIDLVVSMDFSGADEDVSVSELSARFRVAVVRMMTETFGMEKPARIEIEILRSFAQIPDSGENPEPVEKPSAEPAPDSGPSC